MSKNSKITRDVCEKLHSSESAYNKASNLDLFIFILGLVVALLMVRAFVFEPILVDGESMMNTLQSGERCMVEKVSYWFTSPKSGDIVIVRSPEDGKSLIKRVIATGGQKIELRTEYSGDETKYLILIDGEVLDESAYSDTMLFDRINGVIRFSSGWGIDGAENGVYTVPEGYVFVMGDHRTISKDSRVVGPIPLSDVVGRVHGVIFPFKNFRFVK